MTPAALKWALRLAAGGLRLLPLAGKHATRRGWPDQPRPDALDIATWSSYGVAGGGERRLLIVDVDAQSGGLETWTGLPAECRPQTLTVRTPSGGYHYYFQSATALGSTQNATLGIDTRGANGYVVGPGSVTAEGEPGIKPGKSGEYVVTDIGGAGGRVVFAALPAALVAALGLRVAVASSPLAPAQSLPLTADQSRDARAALAVLAPHCGSYGAWLRVLCALHPYGAAGRALALEFSQAAPGFDALAFTAQWDGIRRDGEIGGLRIASVFRDAAAHGWVNSPAAATITVGGSLFLCSDRRNAERLTLSLDGRLARSLAGEWHAFDPAAGWRLVSSDSALAQSVGLSNIIMAEANKLKEQKVSDEIVNALKSFAVKSESAGAISAALSLARSSLTVKTQPNSDPYLIGTPAGIYDLRVGQLRPYTPGDWITQRVGVVVDEAARAPRFARFLAEVFPEDDLREWMRYFSGYCLTGLVNWHYMPTLYGGGANGKGTLINALRGAMGGYARTAAPRLLSKKRDNAHPTELMDFSAARLIVVSETSETMRMDEERVKQLTGGDMIKARLMGKDFVEFSSQAKLIVQTNYKPDISGVDDGIWRRMKLIPFTRQFRGAAADVTLADQLAKESAGILNWCISGARDLIARGAFPASATIEAQTDDWRAEADAVGNFIESRCEMGPYTASRVDVYESYCEWARSEGLSYPLTSPALSKRLCARAGIAEHRSSARRGYRGFRLMSGAAASVFSVG